METRPYNLTGWKKYLFLNIHLFAVRRGRRTLQNRCQFHKIFRADEGICPYKFAKNYSCLVGDATHITICTVFARLRK